MSGNHISDKCRFFSGVFGDFTFSLLWRVGGAHAPSAVTAALGDSCPLTTWRLLAGRRLLYISLGPSTYHEAKPGLHDATISQSHCYWQGILQAHVPIAVCHGLYRRSWGPGGTSLSVRDCSSREWQSGLKAKASLPLVLSPTGLASIYSVQHYCPLVDLWFPPQLYPLRISLLLQDVIVFPSESIYNFFSKVYTNSIITAWIFIVSWLQLQGSDGNWVRGLRLGLGIAVLLWASLAQEEGSWCWSQFLLFS